MMVCYKPICFVLFSCLKITYKLPLVFADKLEFWEQYGIKLKAMRSEKKQMTFVSYLF